MTSPATLVGLDGPVVIVPARVAWRLVPALDRVVAAARRDGVMIDDELAATFAALRRAAHEHARRTAECGRSVAPPTSAPAVSTSDAITTRAAAVRLGLTERGVRDRIARGQLRATKVGAGWLIDPAQLGVKEEPS